MGNEEVFQNSPADDRFVDDPWNVGQFYAAVPDSLRVDYDRRPEFTLVETTRLIGPNKRTELSLLQFGFESVP